LIQSLKQADIPEFVQSSSRSRKIYTPNQPKSTRTNKLTEYRQFGIDFSVGIAQIKVSTAKDLIKRGFYNPNPKDDKLSALPTRELYKYLNDPKYSIYFAAAKIRQIKNDFSLCYNLNRLEVVADLYSRKNLDKTKGKVSSRGKQIAKEFYKIAKKALK